MTLKRLLIYFSLSVTGMVVSGSLFSQTTEVLRIPIYDGSTCWENGDSISYAFVDETAEPLIKNGIEVSQIADGKINYILIEDTASQSGTRIAWVPVFSNVNSRELSSLINYADRIDTTGSEIDFYVGPLINMSFELSDFTRPNSSYVKRFEDGLTYRKIASYQEIEGILECDLLELVSTCEINVPPYDLRMKITGDEIKFKSN
jgi:hypothetical protein